MSTLRKAVMNHDPAVEAARRMMVKARLMEPEWTPSPGAVGAAREALAPIRELHRPMTADEQVDSWPGWIRGDLCAECTSDDTPAMWPCPTAKLAYPSEEL